MERALLCSDTILATIALLDFLIMLLYNVIERKHFRGEIMKELIIEKAKDRAYILVDLDHFYDLGSINCAFGNIVPVLENEFPAENYGEPGFIVKHIRDSLAGSSKAMEIWGMTAKPTLLHSIYDYFNGREKVDCTLKDIEKMRIMYGINISNFPLSITDFDKGMKFQNISTVLDVAYALLYYYAHNDYKLVKCEHCGRWFATTTFKIKYCPRKSTFPGYTHLNCEQAVRNIMQNCGRIKNRIDIKAAATPSAQLRINPFVDEFFNQCEPLYLSAKDKPTVENLSKYHAFLKKTEKERKWLV